MLLREVVDLPGLRLALLTGRAALDRPVSRVYVTDLPDPRRYLSGGELVLTGLMWRRGPDDSARFVAACSAAGVAAIGAGDAAYGSVPPDLVDACRRHGVPLFEVPVEVSFRDIIDQVNPSLWARRAAGLATVLGRYRGLVTAMAAGARLADLLPPVAADLGVRCWVLTPTGRLVAGTGPPPAIPTAPAGAAGDGLLSSTRTAGRSPVEITVDGWRLCAVRVFGRPEHPLASWLLVCAGSDDTPGGALPEATAELASLVALGRGQVDEAARVERRLADQVGGTLSGDADPAELRSRLLSCGLPPDGTFLAVVASLTGLTTPAGPTTPADPTTQAGPTTPANLTVQANLTVPAGPTTQADLTTPANLTVQANLTVPAGPTTQADLTAAVCAEIVARTSARAVVTAAGRPDEVLAIVAVPAQRVASTIGTIRDAVGTLAPELGRGRLAVGVSGATRGAGAVAGAVEQARHARRTAAARSGRATVVSADELASHLLLLAGVPPEAGQLFRDRLLGPLTDYDRLHGTSLVRTLDAFLTCDGSWSGCARLLHLHVNTLRYRIGRIEQLTGRDLSRFPDRVDFFLALRLPH